MAISEAFTGSQSVTTDEWDLPSDSTNLSSQTDDGIYQIFIDFNALANGDEFRFRVYEKVSSGATQRIIYQALIAGVQTGSPIWVSPSLILMHGWTCSLERLAGADRSIEWSIRKVA